MILYDFLLVVIGITIGVIAAEPLKKLFTGAYKEDRRQQKRVKLLVHLRQLASGEKRTTKQLNEAVFRNKESDEAVHSYLAYIEESGLIRRNPAKNGHLSEDAWTFDQKAYERGRQTHS
ncbi:hypothetical protein [Salisediminibacterium halotolerans]|uniref:hypothetical protein n=1 Tax=Salisediminibacterium halotolerans TaxID=517425 RepID=UPI000EB22FB5|nr:hypothetical protein [Salisediminibacterium halotolerans]RLJ71722.1 hypothetical protein BCL39_2394 [Actinophytocola xinjiangensis]RPE86872.1 hypothetical protein EDD67_1735 [Salisediminibacterium halotolerans]TWG32935.1 hypothetical protein BCL52_2389 [Salisediminibacterium halotolerans]GEL08201.1 hypothetical protein SHA02_16170 [Salisediminibacterium halotolerans]